MQLQWLLPRRRPPTLPWLPLKRRWPSSDSPATAEAPCSVVAVRGGVLSRFRLFFEDTWWVGDVSLRTVSQNTSCATHFLKHSGFFSVSCAWMKWTVFKKQIRMRFWKRFCLVVSQLSCQSILLRNACALALPFPLPFSASVFFALVNQNLAFLLPDFGHENRRGKPWELWKDWWSYKRWSEAIWWGSKPQPHFTVCRLW